MLENYDTLEATMLQANKDGMAPERQLELIDFWRDGALDGASADYSDDWKTHQEFASFVDDETRKAKEPLLKSVTENLMRRRLGEKQEDYRRFADEFSTHQDNLLGYSKEFVPLAQDMLKLGAHYDVADRKLDGSVKDQRNNSLADFNVVYSGVGKPSYSKIFFNRQVDSSDQIPTNYIGINTEALSRDTTRTIEQGRELLGIGTKGSELVGGDVIKFPAKFDGFNYLQEKNQSRIDELNEQIEGFLEFGVDQSAAIQERDALVNENNARNTASNRLKLGIRNEGEIQYVKDEIAKRVANNDPKYAEFGQGLSEGFWEQTKRMPGQLYAMGVGGIGTLLKTIEQITPENQKDDFWKPIFAKASDAIENTRFAQENLGQGETVSRLSTYKPELAQKFDKVSSAVIQGAGQAAEFMLLRGVALGAIGLQAAGGSITELEAEEQRLRNIGDIESADWLKANKYFAATRRGAYEALIETIFPAHDPIRGLQRVRNIPQVGPRAAATGLLKDVAQETFEGSATATITALDAYATGISDRAKYIADLQNIPEQGLLEGLGVTIPAGARAAVISMLQNTAINRGDAIAGRGDPPPVSNASDVIHSVTETLSGQPGDHGNPDPSIQIQSSPGYRRYLGHVRDTALEQMQALKSSENVSLPVSANRQGKETEEKSNIYISYPSDLKPTFREDMLNGILKDELENNADFAALPPEEQRAEFNRLKLKLHPTFRAVRNRTFGVGDAGGRVEMISDSDLLKLIERGLDPKKHYFYRAEDAEDNATTQLISSIISADRWIGKKKGATTIVDNTGKTISSKSLDQVIANKAGIGIPTTTIGGRSLHPNQGIAELDDELADPEVTVETRDGVIAQSDAEGRPTSNKVVHGRFISEAGKRKLVGNLNKKYGRNNWILKPDAEQQSVGIIDPTVKGTMTEDGWSIRADIPVMPNMFYQAQQKINKKQEWRANVRVNPDKTVSIMPFGIHTGTDTAARWDTLPALAIPKAARNKLVDLVSKLNNTDFTNVVGATYGLDIIEDTKGNMHLSETNPFDDVGVPGSIVLYSSSVNGMLSMAHGNFSPEAAVTYSAFLKMQATEALAARNLEKANQLAKRSQDIFNKAARGEQVTSEYIPEAADLYQSGVFFSQPDTYATKHTEIEEEEAISEADLPTKLYPLQDKAIGPQTSTLNVKVIDFLRSISTTNRDVRSYLKNLSTALYNVGLRSSNKGMNARMIIGATGAYFPKTDHITTDYSLATALHEIIHALTVHLIPQSISVYRFMDAQQQITGKEYYDRLVDYAAKGDDLFLREVINDYIAAVENFGYAPKVFGSNIMKTGTAYSSGSGVPFYGLTSLDEFLTESLTHPKFIKNLAEINDRSVRFYFRKLLNSAMEWIKRNILRLNPESYNLYDKTFNDIMMFIANDGASANEWEQRANVTYNSNSVTEKLPAGGGFVFGLPKLVQTGKGWVLGGKTLQGKDGLVQEAGLKNIGVLRDAEIELYKFLVPNAFREDGMVNVPMLVEGLKKAESSIRVDVYGQSSEFINNKLSHFNQLRHAWLDHFDISARASIDNYVNGYIGDELSQQELAQLRDKALDRIKAFNIAYYEEIGADLDIDEQMQQEAETLNTYVLLAEDVSTLQDRSSMAINAPIATSAYNSVSPFDTGEFPVIRIDVSIPLQTTNLDWGNRLTSEDVPTNLLWEQDDLHENLPNTLGWAMAQVVKHPTTNEDVLFVAELQSRWQQSRRDEIEYANDPNSVLDIPATIAGHPLLDIYQSLVLKAVIAEAEKRGINKIAISDAESAMMTQGHDRQIAAGREPKQGPGMRLAYDQTLPSIMKRLTGQTGNIESFGPHKNQLAAADQKINKGSPVFKTKEGDPKIQATARVYDVANVNQNKISSLTYYANQSENDPININGTQIKPQHLTPTEQTELASIVDSITNNEKVPSVLNEQAISRLSSNAKQNEFQLLKDLWPNAFDSTKNDKWKGYTNLNEAKYILIDWLVDNPNELDGTTINAPQKDQQSRNRQKLTNRFSKNAKKILEKRANGSLSAFEQFDDAVKNTVNNVLNHVANIGDPAYLTNRELNAINMAMELFIESDGAIIRGFAAMASKLYTAKEVGAIQSERETLMANGNFNPFGDPISDFRRMQLPAFKTGSSLADFYTEIFAIFHRPSTRKVFSHLFAAYNAGINAAKAQYAEFTDHYYTRIRALGKTTLAQDIKIGMAAMLMQDEQSGDQVSQLLNNFDQAEESIRRKRNTSQAHFRRDAVLEQLAFDALVTPIRNIAIAGGMTGGDIVDFIRSQLSPQELALLDIISEPGARYYATLDAINQLARGTPIQNWRNYNKRVQYKLNGETMTSAWGEKALNTADSILQPREALGRKSVFMFNFRPNFDWQLQETAYELHTGVSRVLLFNALTHRSFDTAMDGTVEDTPRASRIRAQVGNIHANFKNRELEFGNIAGAFLETARMVIASKLATIRAPLNQLIPAMNILTTKPKMALEIAFLRSSNGSYRRESTEFLRNANPDLYNRIKKWDYIVEQFQRSDRFKRSGRPGMTMMEDMLERITVGASKTLDKTLKGARQVLDLPIMITNGVTEVLSAKMVFFTLYIDKLIKNGLISTPEEFFSTGSQLLDQVSLSEATAEFDSYVLSPISPEFRSEFAQRNEAGKVVINVLFAGLARTAMQQSIKSVTALRDLYHSSREHLFSPNQYSKEFLKAASKDATKQMLNIAYYYGISYFMMKTVGSLFGATSFVVSALLAGDKEDKDKWIRRLRVLERVEKNNQANFTVNQLLTDLVYYAAPFPGIAQLNPGRSAMSTITGKLKDELVDWQKSTGKTPDQLKHENEQLHLEINKLKKILKDNLTIGSNMRESEIANINKALEFLEYNIELNKTHIARQEDWASRGITNFVGSLTPLGDIDRQMTKWSDYVPDWLADIVSSSTEDQKAKTDKLHQVRIAEGWWGLASYLGVASPSLKAARSTTREFSESQLRSEQSKQKQIDDILKMFNQQSNVNRNN